MPPHPLELPPTLSPDALDTLTELTGILTRLRTAIQTSGSAGGISGTTPAGTGPGATPNPLTSGSGGGGSLGGGSGGVASPNAPLSLKDVPAQTDALKHKLQRARVQMRGLPDMDRSTDEQREEIRELEERIRMQREVLDRLREAGVRFGLEEGGRGDKMETE